MITKKSLFHLSPLIFVIIAILLPGCAKKKEVPKDMEFNELKQEAFASLEKKRNDHAIEVLETIVAKFSDNPEINKFKLLLADTYFKAGKYPAACELYKHFCQYYPSDIKTEYAAYQSVLAQFYQTLRLDCDQTATKETIDLCTEYLKNNYDTYKKDVLDIQNTCEHKLINKEIYVFNFYLKQGKYDAAQTRLNYLRKEYLPRKESLEARLLYLECKLAKKQHKKEEVEQKLELLLEKYPHSQFAQMAQALVLKQAFNF